MKRSSRHSGSLSRRSVTEPTVARKTRGKRESARVCSVCQAIGNRVGFSPAVCVSPATKAEYRTNFHQAAFPLNSPITSRRVLIRGRASERERERLALSPGNISRHRRTTRAALCSRSIAANPGSQPSSSRPAAILLRGYLSFSNRYAARLTPSTFRYIVP